MNIFMQSFVIVAKSTTVGIPIAITGIPNVFMLISFLALFTPAPGTIPVSAICMLLLILSSFLVARASITINIFGFMFCTIPFNISIVSIPVIPSTPGDIADTGLVSSGIIFGMYSNMCLVTSISGTTLGPNASGVTYLFPRPTTSISSVSLTCSPITFLNSSAIISAISSILSSSAFFISFTSKVI